MNPDKLTLEELDALLQSSRHARLEIAAAWKEDHAKLSTAEAETAALANAQFVELAAAQAEVARLKDQLASKAKVIEDDTAQINALQAERDEAKAALATARAVAIEEVKSAMRAEGGRFEWECAEIAIGILDALAKKAAS